MSSIRVFKANDKPREAFADGSWKDYSKPGPLGPIRWGRLGPESIASHAGVSRGGEGRFTVTPVYTSTTIPTLQCDELAARFADPIVAGRTGGIYSRLGHKPGFELECALAGMHGAGDAIVFGSGMAAVSHALLALVGPGDNVVSHTTVYGCTDDFLSKVLPAFGVETRFADLRFQNSLRSAIDGRTRAVFFETPANPTLDLINIRAVADMVAGRCPVIVDNTFASPFGQNPFNNGADVVVYSMTKSISGHTNAIGGAVLGSGPFMVHMFCMRKDIGGMLSPREADVFLTGIKTLPLRYKQMQENAIEVASMLRSHPEVDDLFYPLFDPRYASLSDQLKGPGHMISFILKKGLEGGKTFIDSLQNLVHAVSLGGVETLVCHPASTTHSCIPPEERKGKRIDDGLVRISVGIDTLGDVISDLKQALDNVAKL